jgi:tRNA nucleotidyltransferase/poly(A) polymerase
VSLSVFADGLRAVEAYVHSLGLDAYLVGGVVRDELLGRASNDADFLVAGLDGEQLRSALAPHGRVEELLVAGRPVGMRLYPRDDSLRSFAPAGIEFAPLRRERSTGPGRHDFEIVIDPSARVEDDLARRDFTVNAIARRLADGNLVDPFGGRADLEHRILRAVGPRSFAEDPLRLVRGLRFVSELDLDPDEQTLAQMREHASAVAHVSGERIGGGLSADGMGELSKLLLGARPEKALALARDTGVLAAILPELWTTVGLPRADEELSLDEHVLRVVQLAADARMPLRLRLAALLHELGSAPAQARPAAGSPAVGGPGLGAELADRALRRLRYPNQLRRRVVAIVRFHELQPAAADPLAARLLLARHGEELAFDLLDLREADVRGSGSAGPLDQAALERVVAFRDVVRGELPSPHRLADLAVNGADLLELGYRPGPPLGRLLATLLAEVVEQPARNRRELLLARAEELRRP